jgi:hypothetical protein
MASDDHLPNYPQPGLGSGLGALRVIPHIEGTRMIGIVIACMMFFSAGILVAHLIDAINGPAEDSS